MANGSKYAPNLMSPNSLESPVRVLLPLLPVVGEPTDAPYKTATQYHDWAA
ncbi:hypothetical protein M0657_004130 [Pyricularia oryzae]|uniref:Uncharacterized protein n=2 Tax=Pyricularia oryzae TaxID=318829 RepID=A0AA97P8N1_PYRO3|nr:hypothetical protein OOU_Y34scaffold00099g9 [Pyricularia oryzae Y34]KAI7925557.1 hypothetical protein M0657_004130 [Pyricularia oryzae]KAI7926644.1 hypothetical protein M9X92_002658 [Pyricularia oryzae]